MTKPYVINENQFISLDTGRQRVLAVLFRYPDKEFSLSDLAEEAGVAKANIGPILDGMLRKGLIRIEKLSRIWRIRASQADPTFMKLKTVHNLGFVMGSNLVEFLNEHFHNPKAIVLFGSYRKGEDVSTSDIDIAVETGVEYRTLRLEGLGEFERRAGRKVQIHLFSRKNVDINLFNSIANGIVLSGFLEVKP